MIALTVWQSGDGWYVDVPHGANILRYGHYRTERDAQIVAARLARVLERERPAQGALFPESA